MELLKDTGAVFPDGHQAAVVIVIVQDGTAGRIRHPPRLAIAEVFEV